MQKVKIQKLLHILVLDPYYVSKTVPKSPYDDRSPSNNSRKGYSNSTGSKYPKQTQSYPHKYNKASRLYQWNSYSNRHDGYTKPVIASYMNKDTNDTQMIDNPYNVEDTREHLLNNTINTTFERDRYTTPITIEFRQ